MASYRRSPGTTPLIVATRVAVFALMLLVCQAAWPLGVPAEAAAARLHAANDPFDRVVQAGWGQAPVGGAYRVAGDAYALSVEGATGKMTLKGRGAWATATLAALSLRDVDLRFRVTTNKNATGNGQVVTVTTRRVSRNTEYRSRILLRPNGGVVVSALRLVNGERRLLGPAVLVAGVTHHANSFLWVRVQITGKSPTKIRLKVWQAGEPEPIRWSHSASDRTAALSGAGSVGLGSSLPSNAVNAPVRFTFEDFAASAPNGGDNAPSDAVPPASYSSVADSFNRTTGSGWGSADVGGNYSVRGAAGDYSVENGTGKMTIPSSGVTRSALLTEVSRRDIAISVTFSLNKVPRRGNFWIYIVGRRTGDSEYRARVRVADSGAIYVGASKVVSGGSETLIGHEVALPTTPYTAAARWTVRAQFSGTSPTVLAVMAWPSSASAPSSWQYAGQDSASALQSAGYVGLRAYASRPLTNAPFEVDFDDYAATTAGAAPTTSPTAPPASPAAPTPTPPAPTATPNPTGTPAPAPTSPAPTATPSPTGTPDPSGLYVSTSGSDSSPGTFAAPWRTLQKAADSAVAGSTVYVRAGTYAGFTMSNRQASADNPIVFMGYPGDARPKLDGQNSVAWVVNLYRVSHVNLIGFEVTRGYSPNAQDGGGLYVGYSSQVVVADSEFYDNTDYGMRVYDSTYVTIQGNDIHNNGGGVDVRRGGNGVVILDNDIHNQDRCMGPGTCAVGVGFVKSTGAVLAKGNRIWTNKARSPDYGWDGGGFEIYAASNVTMTDNVLWNSDITLETGTDSGISCANNVYTRNVAYGPTAPDNPDTGDKTPGLLLRCAENMLIAHNTFVNLTWWVYDINLSSSYSGKINGLKIVDNIHYQDNGKIYGLVGANLPLNTFTIDYNLDYNPGRPVASVEGLGYARTTAEFFAWTGFQAHGVMADPMFESLASRDVRLRLGSPAVNAGTNVSGWSSPFGGSAPDIGRYER